MNEAMDVYLPLALLAVVVVGFAAIAIGGPMLIGKRRVFQRVKDTPYECGMPAERTAGTRFSVKFYLVAMIFILFDLEVVFVVGWASSFKEMIREHGLSILWGMVVFLAIVELGHLFLWRQGALDWAPRRTLRAEKDF